MPNALAETAVVSNMIERRCQGTPGGRASGRGCRADKEGAHQPIINDGLRFEARAVPGRNVGTNEDSVAMLSFPLRHPGA